MLTGSLTLKKLYAFNERNRGNVQQINEAIAAERARQEEGDSSGFEDTSSDYDDEEEKDNQPQPAQKGQGASKKQNLDDSFEEVVDKKKKRR